MRRADKLRRRAETNKSTDKESATPYQFQMASLSPAAADRDERAMRHAPQEANGHRAVPSAAATVGDANPTGGLASTTEVSTCRCGMLQ